MRLSRKVILLVYGRATAFAISLLIPLVLTRLLPLEEYGTYRQLVLVYATLQALLLFGMPQALQYYFPRLEPDKHPRLVRQTWGLLLLAGVVTLLLFTAGQLALEELQPGHSLAPYLPLLGLYTGMMLLVMPFQNLLVVEDRTPAAMWSMVGFSIVDVVVLPVAAWVDPTAGGLLHGILATAAIKVVVVLGYLSRYLGQDGGEGFMREQLAYGIPMGLTAMIYVINVNIDKYLVSVFFSIAVFAYYYIGSLWTLVFGWITQSAAQVVMPTLSGAHKRDDLSEMARIQGESVRLLALVFIPLTVILPLVASPLIITLFTADYAAAVPIFLIYILLLPSRAFNPGWILMASRQTTYLMWLALSVSLFNVALSLALLTTLSEEWRLLGIPAATVTATWFSTLILMRRASSTLASSSTPVWPWESLLRISATALLAGIPAAVPQALGLEGLPLVVAAMAIYGIAFLLLAPKLGALQPGDRALLESLRPF
jgi:O-antigen/teichoic acid export membrane protein